MKAIKSMSLVELAAFICSHLSNNGINVVLSGGACVSIYSDNKYSSYDLDFIENISSSRIKLKQAMSGIGFYEEERYFKHSDTDFFVEFPSGPLAVGKEPVKEVDSMILPTGKLNILSPTDCIKDRLAAYYFWNDKQSLEQAILVSQSHSFNLEEIRRWSANEDMSHKFKNIEDTLKRVRVDKNVKMGPHEKEW